MSGDGRDETIVLGHVSGVFGIKGWIKVHSYTRVRESILDYSPWQLKLAGNWRKYDLAEGRMQGEGVVARLGGVDDRDAARALVGAEIAVARASLPALEHGEIYWADLIGLTVVNLKGIELGTVGGLMETGGANDVLIVRGEREHLIPYVAQTICDVDLARGIVRVDWDEDF